MVDWQHSSKKFREGGISSSVWACDQEVHYCLGVSSAVLFRLRAWSTITEVQLCQWTSLLHWVDSSKLQVLALLLELREKQLQKPGRKGNSKNIKTLPMFSGNCFHHCSAFANSSILQVKMILLIGLVLMPCPYSLEQPLGGPARNQF